MNDDSQPNEKDNRLNEDELDQATGGFNLYHPKSGLPIVTPATPACAHYESNSYLPVKVCSTCAHMGDIQGIPVCKNPL
ncbi:MAG: hypothetical protein EOM70_03835 [Clostridia bacterium]|nr:hypothetical protein [Clostridia bacterium]